MNSNYSAELWVAIFTKTIREITLRGIHKGEGFTNAHFTNAHFTSAQSECISYFPSHVRCREFLCPVPGQTTCRLEHKREIWLQSWVTDLTHLLLFPPPHNCWSVARRMMPCRNRQIFLRDSASAIGMCGPADSFKKVQCRIPSGRIRT